MPVKVGPHAGRLAEPQRHLQLLLYSCSGILLTAWQIYPALTMWSEAAGVRCKLPSVASTTVRRNYWTGCAAYAPQQLWHSQGTGHLSCLCETIPGAGLRTGLLREDERGSPLPCRWFLKNYSISFGISREISGTTSHPIGE